VSFASKTLQSLNSSVQGVETGWSWWRTVSSSGSGLPSRLKRIWGFYRTTTGNRTAVAPSSVLENPASRMNNKLTSSQRKHLAAVKSLECGVCGATGPSDAHHIEQGLQFTCIPLCKDCHQGSFNGIHGQKRIWNVMKKTEMTVLNDTIEKLLR